MIIYKCLMLHYLHNDLVKYNVHYFVVCVAIVCVAITDRKK